MKYLVVNVLYDKHSGDRFLYAAIKIYLARNKIGEILYMRVISFLNYIVFRKQYIAQ